MKLIIVALITLAITSGALLIYKTRDTLGQSNVSSDEMLNKAAKTLEQKTNLKDLAQQVKKAASSSSNININSNSSINIKSTTKTSSKNNTQTASPTPNTDSQELQNWFYPNAENISQAANSAQIESTDDVTKITEWYKNKLISSGAVSKTVITNTINGQTNNQLKAQVKDYQVSVKITNNNQEKVRIEISITH